ncbi:zinc ribbon domain-containing protein [Mesorhizobium sp. M0323]|uniref:zinc ribbon domain-containing protein n=1 Tax=Mesorhizobium sp. M0323 TaxID=2956938 RepID=UPI0033379568
MDEVCEGGSPAKVARPIDEWQRILVKDRYPPYIDWPTYYKIRYIVRDNRAEYMRIKTRGAPRNGELLLHGIAWCGRCGHKMYVRYKGGGEYVCNHLRSHAGLPACQHIRASRAYSDEAGHRFRFEAGQSFRFHSGQFSV